MRTRGCSSGVRAPSLYLGGRWFKSIHPHQETNMPFLFLGLIILGLGIHFLRQTTKRQDKDGIVGSTVMIIAGLFMILFFGLFYSLLI